MASLLRAGDAALLSISLSSPLITYCTSAPNDGRDRLGKPGMRPAPCRITALTSAALRRLARSASDGICGGAPVRSSRWEDVLHLHCPVEAGYHLPIAWLARVPRLICTFHSTPGLPAPPAMHVKAWMRRRFATFMSHRVDWVYACSAAVLESQQQSGWHSCNSSVIYNGIDLTQLCLRADNTGAKAALGFSVGAQVIGSVGSLCEQKGQSHLIRCLPLIRRRIPDACLLLVGSGPDGPNLAELARELGCG